MPKHYPRNAAIDHAASMSELGHEAYRLHKRVHDLGEENARLTQERDTALAELDDARQLLAKYRQHVEDCESIDFLDRIGERCSDVTFTPAEQATLLALRGEENGHD